MKRTQGIVPGNPYPEQKIDPDKRSRTSRAFAATGAIRVAGTPPPQEQVPPERCGLCEASITYTEGRAVCPNCGDIGEEETT